MPLLSITGLTKSYIAPDGRRSTVVDVAGFSLEAGSQIAVRGRSGSGKTTFLHLLAGILAADTGSILIDGQDMAKLPESKRDRLRADSIGYIFQTFNLLQGYSALENVLLGMAFAPGGRDRKRALDLLGRVGLEGRLSYRPRQLSTGQQQRVAVARALAKHPKLVLADEPTGNLDRRNADEALQLIREICRENGATLLLVSHDDAVLDAFEHSIDFSELNRAGREVKL